MKTFDTNDVLSSLTRETERLLIALRAAAVDHDSILALGADVQSSLETLWQMTEEEDTDMHKAARRVDACFVYAREVEGV